MELETRPYFLKRLFPYLKSGEYFRLQIDRESTSYITWYKDTVHIIKLIRNKLQELKLDSKNLVITDATGNVGGDTLSFAKYFKFVQSVEIKEYIAEYLRNNIRVYGFTNVTVFNDDYTQINLSQDVLYMDPPWGGASYKDKKSLTLSLSGVPLEHIINDVDKKTKLIVLKLPLNYDICHLMKSIIFRKVSIHNITKMLVVIIETNVLSGAQAFDDTYS